MLNHKSLEAPKVGSLAVPSKDVVIRDFWTLEIISVNVEIVVLEAQMHGGGGEGALQRSPTPSPITRAFHTAL